MRLAHGQARPGIAHPVIAGLLILGLVNPVFAMTGDSNLNAAVTDYDRTVGEAVFVHMVKGCLAGAFAGVLGGNRAAILKGCAVGGGVGGVFGFLDGKRVADAKSGYSKQEEAFDESIQQAKQRNAKLKTIVAVADRLVAERRAEVVQLRAAGDGDLVGRRAKKDELTDEIRLIDAAIAKAREDQRKMKAFAEELRGTASAPEAVSALSTNRAATKGLESKRNDLNHLRAIL